MNRDGEEAALHSNVGKNLCGETTESREERVERRQQEAWLPLALQILLGHTRPSLEHVGVLSLTLDPCTCCFHSLESTPGPKQALPYLLGWLLLNLLIPGLNAASLERSLTALK